MPNSQFVNLSLTAFTALAPEHLSRLKLARRRRLRDLDVALRRRLRDMDGTLVARQSNEQPT